VEEITARIAQVERDLERFKSLVAANASAKVELERILEKEKVLAASKSAAEVKLREAKRLLEQTVLRAPFAGTITEVLLEPGEYATPGRPIVVLSGDRDVEIEVEVPESLISKLSVGDAATVDLPLTGRSGLNGEIRYLGRTATGAGRLFPVLIALDPGAAVSPGMTAEVEFLTDSGPSLSVPLSAVINPAGQSPEVFRVCEGRVERISVKVNGIVRDRVIVSGPLKLKDRIVSGGHLSLLDGDRVEVLE
jgi:RND family efflux transporter MFP subunit